MRTYHGAGDEIRTRDPQLGKLMLYQLSYTRLSDRWPIITYLGASDSILIKKREPLIKAPFSRDCDREILVRDIPSNAIHVIIHGP